MSQNHVRQQYCMLIITSKLFSSRKEIEIDFGQHHTEVFGANKQLIEDTLKVQELDNIVDALNYMSMMGWTIEHLMPFQTHSDGGTRGIYRYLMKRALN